MLNATLKLVPMTPAELVDALGAASAVESEAIKARKALRDAVEALGEGEYDGTIFRATVKTSPVTRVSPDLVRELLSAEDLKLVEITKPETKVRCVARNGKR